MNQQDLAALQAEIESQVLAQAQNTRVTARMANLKDPALMKRRVAKIIETEASEKLVAIEARCKDIVDSMPIYSAKLRENRKWNPSRQYGFGAQIARLSGILNGILYSAADHKVQLLAITELTEAFIESTLKAFGELPFYTPTYDLVTDGIDGDAETLVGNLKLIAEILDLDIDFSAITDKSLQVRTEIARTKAEIARTKAQQTEVLSADKIIL